MSYDKKKFALRALKQKTMRNSKTKFATPKNGEIKWISWTEYYDTSTGEQINRKLATSKNYIITKTNKHVELNYNKTKGHIKYTIECRPNPQTRLQL